MQFLQFAASPGALSNCWRMPENYLVHIRSCRSVYDEATTRVCFQFLVSNQAFFVNAHLLFGRYCWRRISTDYKMKILLFWQSDRVHVTPKNWTAFYAEKMHCYKWTISTDRIWYLTVTTMTKPKKSLGTTQMMLRRRILLSGLGCHTQRTSGSPRKLRDAKPMEALCV